MFFSIAQGYIWLWTLDWWSNGYSSKSTNSRCKQSSKSFEFVEWKKKTLKIFKYLEYRFIIDFTWWAEWMSIKSVDNEWRSIIIMLCLSRSCFRKTLRCTFVWRLQRILQTKHSQTSSVHLFEYKRLSNK